MIATVELRSIFESSSIQHRPIMTSASIAVIVGSERAASSLALELVACDHTRDEGCGSAIANGDDATKMLQSAWQALQILPHDQRRECESWLRWCGVVILR